MGVNFVSDSSAGTSSVEITRLLKAWGQGDEAALDQLMPLVYEALRSRARYYMSREQPGHILQTTALLNETYLRLVDVKRVSWQDRAHFFRLSARMMRRILADIGRTRNPKNHSKKRVNFEEALAVSREMDIDIVALDEALLALATVDERKSQVIELRFFGGRSVEETAEALDVSPETVKRDFSFARAWLHRWLGGEMSENAGEPGTN